MNQSGRSLGDEGIPDEAEEDGPDPWFRPVWEDLPDESDIPPLTLPTRSPRTPALPRSKHGADPLLLPLETAAAALARLDSQAELLPLPLQQGLVARMAYAEAAGWLAFQSLRIHPLDLSLLDNERIDRRELYARSVPRGTASTNPLAWVDMDDQMRCALGLARLLRRLPVIDNPLVTADRAEAWLTSLAPRAGTFNPNRFSVWQAAYVPDGRRQSEESSLLRGATAARAWMEAGISDRPSPLQALAVTAYLLKRGRLLRIVPLPLWAGWAGLGGVCETCTLPRLRSDIAARQPDTEGVTWPAAFLRLVAEAAWAALRMLAAMRDAAAAGAELAVTQDRRSCLPAAIEHLLREPALSAPGLAEHLRITHQAALRLLGRLVEADIATEITGRSSFRVFAVVCKPAQQSRQR